MKTEKRVYLKRMDLPNNINDCHKMIVYLQEELEGLKNYKSMYGAMSLSYTELSKSIFHEVRNWLDELGLTLYAMEKNAQIGSIDIGKSLSSITSTSNKIEEYLGIFEDIGLYSNDKNYFSPSDSINSVKSIFQFEKLDEIKFITELNTEGLIYGNKSEFIMVLIELIKNSIDALNKIENPIITLRFEKRARLNILTVVDNGIGINRQNLNRVRDLGYTTNTTSRGIGLYFVQTIIQNSFNGTVEIESKEHQFTKVKIQFIDG